MSKGNLAHSYLLLGEFNKAKKIYIENKGKIFNDGRVWEDVVKEDFNTFKEYGIKNSNFDTILKNLNL